MTNYAIALASVLIAVTGVGLWPLAVGLAVVVLVGGSALLGSYRRWMAGASGPEHRVPLDRLV
jgi:hypothetical protein